MQSKKEWLGETLSRSGLADLRTIISPGSDFRVLAYHRILDIGPEIEYPCDPELISATTEGFYEQMQFARRHFDIISCSDVIDCMNRGMRLSNRALLVTFDDGHIDNYTNAFPILQSLGVQATIFIATNYIGSQMMFWFDRVSFLLFCARSGKHHLKSIDFDIELGDVASRRHASKILLEVLKAVPNQQRLLALEEAEEVLIPRMDAPPAPLPAAMNWDQIREMSRHGIEFASHSVTHPVLSRLDDKSLENELSASREAIHREIGSDVPAIAYPVGKIGAFDKRVTDMARATGYELGITYESGVNPVVGFSKFELRRLAVERYTTMGMFKSTLAFPGVFG